MAKIIALPIDLKVSQIEKKRTGTLKNALKKHQGIIEN